MTKTHRLALATSVLLQARVTFTRLLTLHLMPWIYAAIEDPASALFGLDVVLDESTVHSPREVLLGGEIRILYDAVHGDGGRFRSLHHDGLAVDVLLYRNRDYVTDGEDPAYTEVGERWLSLSPACRWGREIGDSGHLSLTIDKRI